MLTLIQTYRGYSGHYKRSSNVSLNVGEHHFAITLNDRYGYQQMNTGVVKAKVGQHTVIKAGAVEQIASPSLRSLSPQYRGCRFHDEPLNDGDDFYSQRLCIMREKVGQLGAEFGCVPWDYPAAEVKGQGNPWPLCPSQKAEEFKRAMKRSGKGQDCLADCETVDFQYENSVTTRVLVEHLLCKERSQRPMAKANRELYDMNIPLEDIFSRLSPYDLYSAFMERFLLRNPLNPGLLSTSLRDPEFLREDLEVEKCNLTLRSRYAYVSVMMAVPKVTRIKKDIRYTFTGMIATLGGTLGLFTGMSILSMVEVIFWAVKIIMHKFTTYL